MKQMWIGNPGVGASAYTMLKEGWDPLPMALNIFKCLFTEYSRLSLKMYVYVFSSVRDGHHNLICNCFQVFRVESP